MLNPLSIRLSATVIVRRLAMGRHAREEEMMMGHHSSAVRMVAALEASEACRVSRNSFSSSTKTATSGLTQPNARRRLNSCRRNAPKVAGGEAREDREGGAVDLEVPEKIKSHRSLARNCRPRM